MITISVYKQANYPVSAKKLKDAVKKIFEENGITSEAEASVAIVSDTKITEMAMIHLGEKKDEAKDHPVLSFPVSEIDKPFVFPPEDVLHLGEIVVSYPHAVEDAKKRGILIDDAVCELATHGALHLIGIHHE